MELREKVARAIVKARLFDVDPDTRVSGHTPYRTRDGAYVVPQLDETVALWQTYLDAADAAIVEIRACETDKECHCGCGGDGDSSS